MIISIHALVKRATGLNTSTISKYFISIHALVKRATETSERGTQEKSISIHALVKRATCKADFINQAIYHFNPRPREEGDFFSLM